MFLEIELIGLCHWLDLDMEENEKSKISSRFLA